VISPVRDKIGQRMQFGIQKIPAEERGHVLRRKIKLVMKKSSNFLVAWPIFVGW